MLDLRTLRKEHKKSKPLHVHNNIHSFVTKSGVFLTKDGHVGMLLRYWGPDGESLDPERLDAVTAQMASSLKGLGEEFVFSTYFVKTSNPPLAVPDRAGEIVERVVRDRLEYLKAKGAQRFSFETYLIVLLKPKWEHPHISDRLSDCVQSPRKALRRSLRLDSKVESLDEKLQDAVKTLSEAVDSLIQRSSGAIVARVQDKKETYSFIRSRWNPDRIKAAAVDVFSDLHVDFLTVDSVLECHPDHLRFDDYFVKTLTLKQPSAKTFSGLLQELQRVPADMVVVTEWSVQDNARAISDIRSKRRHWHSTKTSLWSQVGRERPLESEVLRDGSKEALVADLGNCLTEIVMNGVQVGHFGACQ